MIDQNPQPHPLPPHKYPLWIIAFGVVVTMAVLYSLYFLPSYISAARAMESGNQALQNKNYKEAIKFYSIVLGKEPSSKKARISIFEAIFSNEDPADDEQALLFLSGVELNSVDWSRLKKVMPVKYDQYFETIQQ